MVFNYMEEQRLREVSASTVQLSRVVMISFEKKIKNVEKAESVAWKMIPRMRKLP